MASATKKRRLTKNEKRRLRKKLEKQKLKPPSAVILPTSSSKSESPTLNVDVVYVSQKLDEEVNPDAAQFKDVFAKFRSAEELMADVDTGDQSESNVGEDHLRNERLDDDEAVDEGDTINPKISRRMKKILKRQQVAKLKQEVDRPDVVEVHDATSSDPHLLIHLKAFRNTVPIPRHWSAKRKYLQGKRGVEKPPWQLPDFIAQTGIEKIRSATEEEQSAKQMARERVQPKMGRIDIDYAVLHDAFFKHQKKPPLTRHGELYYEGAEFEIQLKTRKPGNLSQALKMALGMPDGAPPPWLINMQRYGPPPSYPSLKIRGLNAPIPKGASFGFHPGGWGKPPVDQFGKPLYGNVFDKEEQTHSEENTTGTRIHWGEIAAEDSEEEEEEDEEEMEEDDDDEVESGRIHENALPEPAASYPVSTVPEKSEQDEVVDNEANERALDLRKASEGVSREGEKQLYKVIDQKSASIGPGIHGSSFQYSVDAESDEMSKVNISHRKEAKASSGANKPQDDFKF
mmetsp:Transcript_12403/g.14453  ORF Transcript_12403/g.14453 Transcript_12403/m.14453 type:complete len:514 (+) Transcript_12403:226-1767(+)